MFVERIKKILKERKILAKDMLSELGINKNQLGIWLKAEKDGEDPRNFKQLYVKAIADYLNVSVAYLYGDKEEPDSDPIQLDDSRVGIMKKLNTLTPDQVKAAEQYIDFLASQTQNQ